MAVDRTAEFQAAVSSIASRSSNTPAESRRLLSSSYTNGELSRPTRKSEFSRMAAKIGHDINSTGAKLQKLAQRILPPPLNPPSPTGHFLYYLLKWLWLGVSGRSDL